MLGMYRKVLYKMGPSVTLLLYRFIGEVSEKGRTLFKKHLHGVVLYSNTLQESTDICKTSKPGEKSSETLLDIALSCWRGVFGPS